MFGGYEVDTFEELWAKMINDFGLQENIWMTMVREEESVGYCSYSRQCFRMNNDEMKM